MIQETVVIPRTITKPSIMASTCCHLPFAVPLAGQGHAGRQPDMEEGCRDGQPNTLAIIAFGSGLRPFSSRVRGIRILTSRAQELLPIQPEGIRTVWPGQQKEALAFEVLNLALNPKP